MMQKGLYVDQFLFYRKLHDHKLICFKQNKIFHNRVFLSVFTKK